MGLIKQGQNQALEHQIECITNAWSKQLEHSEIHIIVVMGLVNY